MTQKNQIYKCLVCGNIVEVLHAGAGELICCGKPMELQAEKTKDEGKEKHVPIIKNEEGTVTVEVGSIPHPMEEKHYLEFIELNAAGEISKKFLKPGDKPQAQFSPKSTENLKARVYCNVHGLWRSNQA